MKKTFKFLGITIVAFVILIVLIFSIIYFIVWNDINSTHDIKTQYGDMFIVSYDSVYGKGNLRIEDFDFYMRLYGDIGENDIVGICNNSEYKCYMVCSTIIFNKIGTETFEILGDDLNSHEELMPVVKSILLKKIYIFRTYLPYFWDKYPYETRTMLQQLIDGKYDGLEKYGLSSDKQEIVLLSEVARDFINNNS